MYFFLAPKSLLKFIFMSLGGRHLLVKFATKSFYSYQYPSKDLRCQYLKKGYYCSKVILAVNHHCNFNIIVFF